MARELHLELLLGQCIFDAIGQRVGHIEEVRAEQQGDDWVIVEYYIGFAAVVQRLSAWNLATGLLRLLGARTRQGGYRVPWDKLDLSDIEHPRLVCSINDLEKL